MLARPVVLVLKESFLPFPISDGISIHLRLKHGQLMFLNGETRVWSSQEYCERQVQQVFGFG